MNRVELSGTVVRDPEFPPTRHDGLFAYFTVAVAGVRWDHDTRTDVIDTVFVSVIAGGDVATQVTALRQGSGVHVVGELCQQEIEKAGRKERKTKVRAMVVTVLRTPEGQPDF